MSRFPFATYARLLPEPWMRERFARLSHQETVTTAERVYETVTHRLQARGHRV